jgi:hypothetical protein
MSEPRLDLSAFQRAVASFGVRKFLNILVPVILSAAKHLSRPPDRPFASLL